MKTWPEKLPVIYSPAYDCPEATDLPSTRKQALLHDMIRGSGMSEGCQFLTPEPADTGHLRLAHTEEYIHAFLTGEPRALAESQGFHWSEKFRDSVLAVNGGHLLACKVALDKGVAFHLASGAHHARRERGSGYCTFNYLAWCSLQLLQEQKLQRVLIVDLDTHQGDGTYTLTRDNPNTRCFDISGGDMGVPPHHESDGDYWLLGRESFSERYFEALGKLPAVLDAFEPDLVQYQAGMDCYEGDPVMEGVGLTKKELSDRDRIVIEMCREKGTPLVVNLAGGYCGLETVAQLHFQTFAILMANLG